MSNPPTSLSATNGDTEVTISFTSGSDGGSAITDYLYSTDGLTYTSTGDATSPITISGLTNGVTYSITLKAVNVNGNSIASSPVSATPNVVQTIQTFTTVGTTSWTAPSGVTSVEYLLVSGGGGGGQNSSNNYGRYNSGGPGNSGINQNFDGSGIKNYGAGGNGGVPNTVATGTTTANVGKGGDGTGATLNSFANGIAGGSGIVMLKYYT